MKRLFTTLFLLVLVCASVWAQAPQKMGYQAVVRNANNSLVTNQSVSARMSILQGSATGSAVYVETQMVTTNVNGLMTLSIGEGTVVSGTFSGIDWASGPYFLKSEIDPDGGVNYSIESVQQLLSVPYALYAKEAGNSFSGDYNDLTNTPVIPTVPTNVSAFTNDAGYITMDSIPAMPTVPTNVSAFTNDAGYITMDSISAIPTIPTNVSAFTNDAGYLTGYTETDPLFSAWDKNYNDLTNTPTIPTVPTNVSAFTNDAGYITMDSIPAMPTVPTNVSAFTNDAGYITMDSVPVIPTNVSAFTNDAGYLTSANVQEAANIPTNVSAFTNDAGYITMDSIPTIPTVPANVSAFTNDAGYITMDSIPTIPTVPTNVSVFNNDAGYITMDSIPTIPTVPTNVSAFTNDAGYITMDSIPTIPTVPANVSAFTNDAGYITMDSIPAIPAAANDATLTIQKNGESVGTFSANAADNQTVNITVPTQTSQLENNSGYITMADVQQLINALNNRIDSLENVINGGTTPPTPEDTVDGGPCPGHHTLTDVEGNTYNTVWIGGQCWMKENLRTRKYADSTPIPLGTTASTTNAYRYYPYGDSANVVTYGYLYNWTALMHGAGASSSNPSNVQGVCPDGWHLPSQGEWNMLINYLQNKSEFRCGSDPNYIAKALADSVEWISNTATCAVGNTPTDNNLTGFSVIPAGWFYNNAYSGSGQYAYLWSCSQSDATNVWIFTVSSSLANVSIFAYPKDRGFSVRCIKGAAGSVALPPSIITDVVSGVSQTTAVCGGDVTNDGGAPVTARGVCYGISGNVTLDNSTHTVDGSGTGPFTSNLTGLTPGTTYRVRAYATNSEGTTYGTIKIFTTTYSTDGQPCPGAATVTDVDGNVYNTIMLGNVCWMKENLRTTKFQDGTPIALGTDSSSTVAYRYYPNNDPANVATYGYLYNWSAFIHNQEGQNGNLQGICPTGWHIPKGETAQLSNYVSGQADYICDAVSANNAKAVASTTGWSSSSTECSPGNAPESNNVTGFNLPPAGYYYANPSPQITFGIRTYMWHANSNGTLNLWPYGLNYASPKFSGGGGQPVAVMKTYGYSVRCVRN